MLERYVKLNSIDEVKSFVHITSSKEYAITLESDKYIVDAKSIMGVLSLDLTKPLLIKAECKASGELLHQLEPFLCHFLGKLKK